jgi:hypothetical protein
MKKSKKIQTTVDEFAAFTASAIAGAYSILGKELKGHEIRKVYEKLIIDISHTDLRVSKKDFMELLSIYELAEELKKNDLN